MLTKRYRIVGLLGKGGMGEVYRADDLELGQSVALKFLPGQVAGDAARLARFRSEVRVARQVSHSNVCRVYDLGEVDGRYFLSMEYIDGEDLAAVLRRMGRPSKEKAVQIARQLCAGVAAAHSNNVLHRDLKPANVMIDGQGRVRITDFGLAGFADEFQDDDVRVGTPAYMAPEQLAGKEVSIKSDIYSLGLVLFEVFTGKRAFQAESIAEIKRLHEGGVPSSMSGTVEDLDPAVERVILHCLETNPHDRPASALAVAASLPGGDAMAAALAAGETPSPELVAASGEVGALRPVVALALVALFVAGVLLTAWMNDNAKPIIANVPLDKPPAALVVRAKEIIQELGYSGEAVDSAFQLYYNNSYMSHISRTDDSARRWERLAVPQPATVRLWLRQSSRPLLSTDLDGRIGLMRSPPLAPGDVVVSVSAAGDLVFLGATRPAFDTADGDPPVAFDWRIAFEAADLDFESFNSVDSVYAQPHIAADTRLAWTGKYRNNPEQVVRVEAASLRGWPVAFTLVHPWNIPSQQGAKPLPAKTLGRTVGRIVSNLIHYGVLLGAVFLAYRNVRRNRGDRRGATRLAIFCAASITLGWAVAAHHAGGNHLDRLAYGVGWALYTGAIAYAMYLALEPFIRRKMPRLLVSSARLLAGRWRDPLVGRDVLLGIAASACVPVVTLFFALAYQSSTGAACHLDSPEATSLQSLGLLSSNMLYLLVLYGVWGALLISSVFCFLVVITRRRTLAILSLLVLLSAYYTVFYNSGVIGADLVGAVGLASAVTFLLVRFGLLSVFAYISSTFCYNVPVTLRGDAWYAVHAYAVAAFVLAIAVVAYRVACAGQPLLRDETVPSRPPS